MNVSRYFAVTAWVLLLGGCATVGPDYEAPKIDVTPSYNDSDIKRSLGDIATKRWWENFEDPVLDDLVRKGLAQNLDIAVAVERIAAAQATLRSKGVNAMLSGSAGYALTGSGANNAATTTAAATSLSGGIVIDLFGGIRREQQAAEAQLKAAIDDVGTARLAYLSELIGAYIEARYYQYAIKLTRDSIATREQTLDITQKQHTVGTGTELDTEQVKALLYAAQADIPDLEANYLAQVYAMATLLQTPASELDATMQRNAESISLLGLNLRTEYDTGIPADLLRNRPDIRAAEQDLIAATANIGVATADMLPSLELSGTVSDLRAGIWSFGPTLTLPIFNQGALAAERDIKVSEAKQAEITWRQTVLNAVEDVQSANSAWRRDHEKVQLLKNSMDAYQRALDLSMQTYKAGVTTLLDLLVTDRSLASARLSFADALRTLSVDWATLQIALGAGADAGADEK